MTAFQDYIANVVTSLTPHDVATLVANPPQGRSAAPKAADIHAMVIDHAEPPTAAKWADLLAAAAGVKREGEWAPTWALPIAELLYDPSLAAKLPVEGEVHQLERAAA